ncbi:uncharacterized protein DFL_006887 [Arthrobotrys flagrans]|uniref:Uncharacterized protein n=1 Tax=Arthrobotrys flagrans TaxID=97331 RepID=A0A436ZU35_ARTFL|nr:hypothetical protein DFL_006887 [Arthrobotrys flagrans]
MPKLQPYMKYGNSVRHLGLSNFRGPSLMAYVCALRQVLRTCLSLTDVSIELRYGIENLTDMSVLEDRFALEPPVPQSRLLDLSIRLGQMAYSDDLAPTYSMLNLICKLIGSSSQRVRSFRFEVGVHDLHKDFDKVLYLQSDWAIIERDQDKPVSKVEKIQLDFTETTLSRSLFLDFCHVDTDKIRELELWNMIGTELCPIEEVCIIFFLKPSPRPIISEIQETLLNASKVRY